MKRDSDKIYTMPLLAGPLFGKREPLPYPESEGVLVQYETEGEAIAALLPECYQVGAEPIVTVYFGYNRQLSFLAGGGYSLATVQVRARFDGDEDHIDGDYVLVMFENKTLPIIGGREHLGVPKLHADIPPIINQPDTTGFPAVRSCQRPAGLHRLQQQGRAAACRPGAGWW
ncbi:MAG: acetoacetate decarboxylase family protein, partial [Candidatus Promineifilaceae bacterium]